jgi:hypothetical protein
MKSERRLSPRGFCKSTFPLTKVAGKPSANYLCRAPCELGGICLGFEMKADLRSW